MGWQPSRFLTDRGEAERAFQLAQQLGSVNAAATQLGTTWPSLRKAFTRHGLGMPTRIPEAVRQRAITAARQRSGQPAAGGLLLVWGFVRPHADVQRLYGVLLGFAALLIGSVQLAGAMNVPAAAGQMGWRRLRPRWPVITGVVVIALITAGIGMAAAAITSPDPHPDPGPCAVRPNPFPVRCLVRPLLIRFPAGLRDCSGSPWW